MAASPGARDQPAGCGRWCLISPEGAPVPPDGSFQSDRYSLGVRVPAVDDDVAFHARDDRWDDHDCAFDAPRTIGGRSGRAASPPGWNQSGSMSAVTTSWLVPLGMVISMKCWVWRQRSVPVHQHFQHGRRVALGGVDHLGAGLVPPAGGALGAFRTPHRKSSRRIADSVRPHRLRQGSWRHQAAMPASARRMRFSTASAPAELDRAMSKGVSASRRGCGRFRNVSIAFRSPW